MSYRYLFASFLSLYIAFTSLQVFAEEGLWEANVQGRVSITGAYCPPPGCETRTGAFSGTLTIQLQDENLVFTEQKIRSEVEGFVLPKHPNLSEGGVNAKASYRLTGNTMLVEGVVDSRAFDGPLVEYTFTADLSAIEQEFLPTNFYTARQDYRKCASPMCGGIYISKLNRRYMRCADGSWSRECYVGGLDASALESYPFEHTSEPVLQGKIALNDPFYGDWGLFVARAGYRPIEDPVSAGVFVGVQNNGIVCITSPCFSFDAYILNSKHSLPLSGVDLSRLDGSKSDLEQAQNILGSGEVLLASGYLRWEKGFAGWGRKLVTTNAYLPLAASEIKPVCETGYRLSDMGCVTRHGCFYPQMELVSIGGAAYIDPETGELMAEQSYSCVDDCAPPAEVSSPGYCSLALP